MKQRRRLNSRSGWGVIFLLAMTWPTLTLAQDPSDCENPTDNAKLAEVLLDAIQASLSGTTAQFEEGRLRADEALSCLEAPISPGNAALVHQLHVSHAVQEGDLAAAQASLTAMFAADPDVAIPDGFAPSGSALAELVTATSTWSASPLGPEEPMPAGVRLTVDGADSTGRPIDRPAVLQPIGPGDVPVWTQRLEASAPLPAVPPPPLRPPQRSFTRATWALTAGAGACAVAGGVLGWRSAQELAQWEALDGAPDRTDAQIRDQHSRVNALGWSARGAGVVAAGLAAGATLSWAF